ncbi:hypothetical protein FRC11_008201 [Ceratobasidium sp. 423]|nr:hypothetical protein FRC11_008201 [Ceratobasidium sp. 423]
MSAEAIFYDVLKEMYPERKPEEICEQICDGTLTIDKEKMIGLFLEKTAEKLDSDGKSQIAFRDIFEEFDPKVHVPKHPGPMPKHPIVLCHGVLGFDKIGKIHYWKHVKSTLEFINPKLKVFEARVPATSDTITRAKALREYLDGQFGDEDEGKVQPIHLVAHSMGGLDCRYLVKHLMKGARFKVLSISTINTPHWGSPYADYLDDKADMKKFLHTLQGILRKHPEYFGDGQALESLRNSSAVQFNIDTPNVQGVRYLSWGSTFEPEGIDGLWNLPYKILSESEGINDGVVSIRSAFWGEFRGIVPDMNHGEIIGQKFVRRTTEANDTEIPDKSPKHLKFYCQVANILATEVEE